MSNDTFDDETTPTVVPSDKTPAEQEAEALRSSLVEHGKHIAALEDRITVLEERLSNIATDFLKIKAKLRQRKPTRGGFGD